MTASRYPPKLATPCRVLAAIRETGLRGGTLLDIGGGSGVIPHALLGKEVASGTLVDAAAASLAEASFEAQRRGHECLVAFLHGDFVDLAERTRPADLVLLVARARAR